MGTRTLIGIISLFMAFVFVGCDSDKAQKIEPETRGKRGERCQARNDCDTGLACLNGICAKNEFDIEVTAKHCDRVECAADADCCGDRATMAPAKCDGRNAKCEGPATLPGCFTSSCTSDASCQGGGTCGVGTCNFGGGDCTTAAECADVCTASGVCSKSLISCVLDTDCTYNGITNCSNRSCNCANPEYDPTDPICSDEDCENICFLRCEDELCVEDDSCKVDTDCAGTASICDDGRCVQCIADDDCDEEAKETCEKGQCEKPCEFNEECGLFEQCQEGDCVYVGCDNDLSCILAAARGQDGVGGSASVSTNGDDPRLFQCLPSELEPEIKTCKIPCENDGSCGQFQVCEKGYCKFVGCETNEQCIAYLGLTHQMTSEIRPFVTTGTCRE